MRGVAFAGNRTIEFIEVEDPIAGPGEVVIEVRASGICGSDLHMYRGQEGMSMLGAQLSRHIIRGHEVCGEVVEVGRGVGEHVARMGARVMVHHYWGCGHCDRCLEGWPQMCTSAVPTIYGIGAHGGHAPYIKVPSGTLVPLEHGLSFEAGAAISCCVGTVYASLRRLRVVSGQTIVIFGQGPLGLSGTQLATALGARVIAVEPSPNRRVLARALGADVVLDPNESDPVSAIRELTSGAGAAVALETSGATTARSAAVGALAAWGTLALLGVGGSFRPDVRILMRQQINVFGLWTFSTDDQARCGEFAVKEGISIERIVTDRCSLEDARDAYCLADRQVSGKVVFLR